MAIEIQAPNKLEIKEGYVSIFLGGSIENGKAVLWQQQVIKELENCNYIFLNPRRDDWDSSWVQKESNPQFKEQVLWELKALEFADMIIMYFDPNTMSPISLLETGLHAKSRKLIIYCPEPFWKKGNIDVTSEYYGIRQVNSFEDLISILKCLS